MAMAASAGPFCGSQPPPVPNGQPAGWLAVVSSPPRLAAISRVGTARLAGKVLRVLGPIPPDGMDSTAQAFETSARLHGALVVRDLLWQAPPAALVTAASLGIRKVTLERDHVTSGGENDPAHIALVRRQCDLHLVARKPPAVGDGIPVPFPDGCRQARTHGSYCRHHHALYTVPVPVRSTRRPVVVARVSQPQAHVSRDHGDAG